MKITNGKDFWAGLMFIAFGLFFLIGAVMNYQMGTAVRMGPAYFPTWLGWILAGLATLIVVEAFTIDGHDPRPTRWKPLGMILGSVVLFALLVGPLNGGLVAACFLSIIMCAAGGDEFKWIEILALAAGLTIVTVLTFVNGLGLPFPLFPWS